MFKKGCQSTKETKASDSACSIDCSFYDEGAIECHLYEGAWIISKRDLFVDVSSCENSAPMLPSFVPTKLVILQAEQNELVI